MLHVDAGAETHTGDMAVTIRVRRSVHAGGLAVVVVAAAVKGGIHDALG